MVTMNAAPALVPVRAAAVFAGRDNFGIDLAGEVVGHFAAIGTAKFVNGHASIFRGGGRRVERPTQVTYLAAS